MAALVAAFFMPSSISGGAVETCSKRFDKDAFRGYALRIYRHRDSPLRADQKRRIRLMRRCMNTDRGSAWAWRKKAEWRREFRARLRAQRLTPYAGPGGTRWAIPWYIVACESGGSWGAYNPSGAAGPYQIMPMWGRPWPANTASARLAHHRIAARIWAGGSGASNWACA